MGATNFNGSQVAGQLISNTVLGADATSVVIATTLPTIFTHLRMVLIARTDRAGNDFDNLKVRFNGDTTAANYLSTFGFGGTSSGGGVDGSGFEGSIAVVGGATTPANEIGTSVLEIPFYQNTSWRKAWSFSGMNPRSGSNYTMFGGGRWASTAAITSLTIYPAGGTNIKANSQFSLYGIY